MLIKAVIVHNLCISRYTICSLEILYPNTHLFLQACTFLARSDLKKPSNRLGFAIGDSVKPKTRDNVTADMKIRCFSLTILDSFCGMV